VKRDIRYLSSFTLMEKKYIGVLRRMDGIWWLVVKGRKYTLHELIKDFEEKKVEITIRTVRS